MRYVALLALLLSASLQAAPIVVVISMDGVRWDYPDLYETPALARMVRNGVRAERLVPVYPSNTFPGHVSIATGAHPRVHGIVDNVFFDRQRGVYAYDADASWLRAEPLWIAAERQGVKAATYFWVGSETDWQGQRASYRIAPFDGGRPEAAKVAQMLEWLALPEPERPRLIMSYFAGTDSVGHDFGPRGGRVAERLQAQDAALMSLLQGIDELALWDRLTLVLVSDHGMTPMGDYIPIQSTLTDAGISARVFGTTVGHVFLERPGDLERARKVLVDAHAVEVLDQASAVNRGLGAEHRTGDLVALAEPPQIFVRPGGFAGAAATALRFFGWDFGGHGYDPALEDMGGVFLALGAGVRAGATPGALHQIDVAPTVATLLGIEPPLHAEGEAALEVLRR